MTIESRITAVAGEERAAALGAAATAAEPEPVVDARAKYEAEQDAAALAAFREYSGISDRFARARAMVRLGAAAITRGYELAKKAK